MNYNDEIEDWQGQDCGLKDNTSIDISKCLGNDDHLSGMFGDATTPVKFCGDLAYHLPSNEGTSSSGNNYLDPSPNSWIADCFNDAEMLCIENLSSTSGASDVQIDITELCNKPPENDANGVETQAIQTPRKFVFEGKKSYIYTPPKLPASAVVCPFTFIKPCGMLGDTTLKDINQRIHAPKSNSKENEQDPCEAYPTSAFSGKPVLGKPRFARKVEKAALRSSGPKVNPCSSSMHLVNEKKLEASFVRRIYL